MNLSDRMKTEAVALGLCAQWTAEWEDKSGKDAMVEKFVNGIDFCIKHDWPSCEVMKRDFGDVIHRHGVYVDEKCHLASVPTVVLNGHCDASATYGGYNVATVYVRHRSKLDIRVSGLAKVRVCAYDECRVSVRCDNTARCTVYVYGEGVTCEGGGTLMDRRQWAREHLGR